MPYTIASVDMSLTLLQAVADEPGLGVTALAQRIGATKSQAFRLLYTLEGQGFVIKDAVSLTYRLGYRALYVGERAKRQVDLIARAGPYLDDVAAACRENVHVIAREGVQSVCIALRESPQNLRLYAAVGRLGPLHAGGGSKVVLAYADQAVRDAVLEGPLERYTDATIVDPTQLRAVLDTICRDGYHVAIGDIDEDAFSVAAPIVDHADRVVAALSIAGPTSRLDEAALAHYRTTVLQASAAISRALR